jgi:hypothetical protein
MGLTTRLALVVALLAGAVRLEAQTQTFPTGPLVSHVIVDSCSGCSGGAPGQATMAASSPVVIASDQSAVHVVVDTMPAGGAGLTDLELRATPVPVSGTVTVTDGAGALNVICDSGCAAGAPGQQTMAASSPVVIASNQSAVPVSGTFWQATQPVSGTFWQATQPVSGTVTTSPPANASTNVAQLAGTATSVNSGTKDAGTLRVVLATDQPALTNKLLVTPDSVALPANQSVNVSQVAGTTTDTNSGTKSAGTLRVVLATDQPALTNKLLVTPDANSAINVAQIAGSATSTAASGVQKVGVVGNAGAAFDAANNAAMPANALAAGVQTATIDTTPTAATAGNLRYQLASTEGVVYVQEGGPKRFSCVVPSSTTATTQCQAAPAAGLRAYVTSLSMSNAAATVQTLDVVFGTGTNCATSPTALTHKVQFGTNAITTSPQSYGMQFQTPLVPTAANAICVRPSAATAFGATITGYIAP